MQEVKIVYDPYLPELRISVNGKKLSPYSSLMRFSHQRFEVWCGSIFAELYRELHTDYTVLCCSTPFVCSVLRDAAREDAHCLSFCEGELPCGGNVYERFDMLARLGYDGEEGAVLPVLSACGSDMLDAFFEVLGEEGLLSEGEESLYAVDCPQFPVEIRPCQTRMELPEEATCAVLLAESDTQHISLDVPLVCVLVIGTETRFLRQEGNAVVFSVDGENVASLLLGIIAASILTPNLSRLAVSLDEAFFTEAEKREYEVLLRATPACRAQLPTKCFVGRAVEPEVEIYPEEWEGGWHFSSSAPEILEIDGDRLIPRAAGTAEISVMIGDDPYPAANVHCEVLSCTLLTQITAFPSVLYLPMGGSREIELTILPENAENRGEIAWRSDDPSVADVEGGIVRGLSCGRCTIEAYTAEASCSISTFVQPALTDIEFAGGFAEVRVGEKKEWRFHTVPPDAYGVDAIRIYSSDKSVAEYSGGYVIGRGVGRCKIFFRHDLSGISREIVVTVKK